MQLENKSERSQVINDEKTSVKEKLMTICLINAIHFYFYLKTVFDLVWQLAHSQAKDVTFLLNLKKVPVKRRLAFFCKKGKTKDLVISVVRRFRSVFMI